MTCSHDNKILYVGMNQGLLSIVDIEKLLVIKHDKAVLNCIYSLELLKDNEYFIASDSHGFVRKIRWKADTRNKQDLELIKNYGHVGIDDTKSICLTEDEQNLLVGSLIYVRVLNLESGEVIKEFKLKAYVIGISLIDNGNKAVIAEDNGCITIIDVNKQEICETFDNLADGQKITTMKVICM